MINYLKVTNPRGEELKIEMRSPEKSGFFIRGINGLGPSKSILNMGESLYEDGAFFNSVRVSQRNLVLNLGFYDYSSETIEQIRNKSYSYFPMKKPLNFEIKTDSRLGLITGYVESNEPNIFSKDEGTQISIVCPSAYFLGADNILTVFSGTINAFTFPFENPSTMLSLIEFGTIFVNTNGNVFYEGDVDTGVIIHINFLGAVNNLTISNTSTGTNFAIDSAKVTALTGHDFQAGDVVTISTLKGSKSITLVRSNVSYNILNAVSILSDWFQIQKGDNVFVYTAVSGTANMQFAIEHRQVYEGL